MNAVSTVEPQAIAAVQVAAPVQIVSGSDALMRIIERAALQPEFDLARVERLLQVKKEWDAEEARKAYSAAMAAFRAEPIEIFKRKAVGYTTKDGEFVGYKHAELSDVTDAVDPVLAKHGLSYRWEERVHGDIVHCACIVSHALGHEVKGEPLPGPLDTSGKKNKVQQLASTISYLRRYTLLGILGKATKGEDDDGRGDEGDGQGEQHQGEPQRAAQAQQDERAFYPAADFEKNLPGWLDAIAKGTSPEGVIRKVQTKAPLTEQQKARIRGQQH